MKILAINYAFMVIGVFIGLLLAALFRANDGGTEE